MRKKSRGKAKKVAIKFDSKTYDRIKWDYLKLSMLKMGFAARWVEWIMLCVSTVTYTIVVNGELLGPIKPKRGLR